MDNLSQQFQRIKFQNKHFSKREKVVMYVCSVVVVSSGGLENLKLQPKCKKHLLNYLNIDDYRLPVRTRF